MTDQQGKTKQFRGAPPEGAVRFVHRMLGLEWRTFFERSVCILWSIIFPLMLGIWVC